MSLVSISFQGDFSKTFQFLRKKIRDINKLNEYGKMGVEALSSATPRRTGKTAESWTYEVHYFGSSAEIVWKNTNVNKGVNIAVLIQYGHGTGTGGYVQGIDYINPAMRPVFDKIAQDVYMEVTGG